ncbi:Putative DNA glycosylase At3g47830 [Galdieria sulphuraria]|nr:Putative DNA glycosylase At3g47830 [Galdieria sulphuraria]
MFLQIDRQLIVSGFSYRLLLANFPKRFSLQLARGVFPISVGANTVLDTLIAVMLSQNTTDRNSTKAFEQLKTRYEDWNQVIEAPLRDVEECIRVAGLAKTKAARIKELLETLQKERGELSLESLRGSCTETVEKELSRFKGVGLKTMACVSAFSLGLQVFPVDTHVFRVCKRLGWISPNCSRDQAFRSLNSVVPLELRVPLHFLIISHGRETCRSQSPRCEACTLQKAFNTLKFPFRIQEQDTS